MRAARREWLILAGPSQGRTLARHPASHQEMTAALYHQSSSLAISPPDQHLINPVAFPAPAPTWSGHQAWHRAPLATPPAFSWCAAASAFCPCSSNWRTYSVHSWRSRLRMSRLILGHISADTAVELESIDQHFRQASFAEFKMLMTFDDEASKRYGLPKSIVEQVLIKVYQCLSKK